MEHPAIGRTIIDVIRLVNGKTAFTLDDQSTIVASFPSYTESNPIKARFGRIGKHQRPPSVTHEADAMRQADEVAHLGGRKAGRKTIVIGDTDTQFGSSEFMPDYNGVDRSLDEQGRHNLRVAQSTSDIPDIR